MSEEEQKLYDATVHGLRSRGWPRIDAESEALDRIELRRQRKALPETTPKDTLHDTQ